MEIFAKNLSNGNPSEKLAFEGKPMFVCKGDVLRGYSFEKDIAIRAILSQVSKLHRQRFCLHAVLHNIGIIEAVLNNDKKVRNIAVIDENVPVKIEIFSCRPNKPEVLVCTFLNHVAVPEMNQIQIRSGVNVEREIVALMQSHLSRTVTNECTQLEIA